jgi:hypothetical protein
MIANTALILGKRRLEKRFDCEAKVKWSYFNKRRYFDAKIINCSPNGNYFESPHEIIPGETILIRLENLLSKIIRSDDPLVLRTVYLAEVKWCKKASENGDSYFGVGVRHLDLK